MGFIRCRSVSVVCMFTWMNLSAMRPGCADWPRDEALSRLGRCCLPKWMANGQARHFKRPTPRRFINWIAPYAEQPLEIIELIVNGRVKDRFQPHNRKTQ